MTNLTTRADVLDEQIRRMRKELDEAKTELDQYAILNPQQCPAGKHADWLVDSEYTHACPWCQIEQLKGRVSELEGPAVYARAALAALCYDLEDPGTNALGALYQLQQVTGAIEAPRDEASAVLAQHDANVLTKAAERINEHADEKFDLGVSSKWHDGTYAAADLIDPTSKATAQQ